MTGTGHFFPSTRLLICVADLHAVRHLHATTMLVAVCCLLVVVESRIVGVPQEKRDEALAQEILSAALQGDRNFALEAGGEGDLASKRIVAEGFTFWTTGLDVDVEEEEDEPPSHRYMGDDEDEDSGYHGTDYSYDDFDRFAGSKTHSTVFAGFASRRLDMDNFEYSGPCPIPECGEHVFELKDDDIDDPTGIREALRRRRDALDIEHVYDASVGEYGGVNPDELMVKVCSKGCMYGHASVYLSMAGKLGWSAGAD